MLWKVAVQHGCTKPAPTTQLIKWPYLRTPDYRWGGQMKIAENPGVMYGQNFKNFSQYVRIAAGMHGKSQNLLGWPIGPPKNLNLFGPANQASRNSNFVRIGLKKGYFALRWCRCYEIPNHSASTSLASPALPRPFLRAATIALTALNIP
jgi:hypothetical protein